MQLRAIPTHISSSAAGRRRLVPWHPGHRDQLTLYWLTNSATSSARLYWENGVPAAAQKTTEISLPVAITVFPEEIYRAPETWARRAYRNLIPRGRQGRTLRGVEQPELFATEI
jgi:hypothetical protein